MTFSTMLGLRQSAPFVVGDLSATIGTRKAATIESGDVGDGVKDGKQVLVQLFRCLGLIDNYILQATG